MGESVDYFKQFSMRFSIILDIFADYAYFSEEINNEYRLYVVNHTIYDYGESVFFFLLDFHFFVRIK